MHPDRPYPERSGGYGADASVRTGKKRLDNPFWPFDLLD